MRLDPAVDSPSGRWFVVKGIILVAAVALVGYAAWAVLVNAGGVNRGIAAALISAATSAALCIVAFALGFALIRNEIAGGTAEALVLTPAPKAVIVTSRFSVLVKIMLASAVLLPMNCVTINTEGDDRAAVSLMQGGASRAAAAYLHWYDRVWPAPPPPGTAVSSGYWGPAPQIDAESLTLGLGCLVSDMTWYALFGAAGLLVAILSRARGLNLVIGLLACLLVFAILACADTLICYLSMNPPDPDRLNWPWHYGGGWGWGKGVGGAESSMMSLLSFGVPLAVSLLLRIMATGIFLRQAARHFDRIATD
jgi:hypothetical protein